MLLPKLSHSQVSGVSVPPRYPYLTVGHNPTSFIFYAAHEDAARNTLMFDHRWACPSRDRSTCLEVAQRLRVNPADVSPNLNVLLQTAQAGGKKVVVNITTSTDQHLPNVLSCAKAGVRAIICDKPFVRSWDEYVQAADALRANNVTLFVTYNHIFDAAVFAMRARIAELGARSVASIDSGFLQSWLRTDPKIQQSGWRLGDKSCGLSDIGTHAAHLALFVGDSDIESVENAELGTAGEHGADAYDNGSWSFRLQNGITGTTRFHQALEGSVNDIYIVTHFTNGEHWLWKMAWSADSLFVSTGNGDTADRSQWTQHYRGASELFPDWVSSAFGHNPPGHVQGWNNNWDYLFRSAAGQLLREDGWEGEMPGCMTLPVPGFSAARNTTLLIESVLHSHDNGGSQVRLEELAVAEASAV